MLLGLQFTANFIDGRTIYKMWVYVIMRKYDDKMKTSETDKIKRNSMEYYEIRWKSNYLELLFIYCINII